MPLAFGSLAQGHRSAQRSTVTAGHLATHAESRAARQLERPLQVCAVSVRVEGQFILSQHAIDAIGECPSSGEEHHD
jgi:hypothetical protein